MPKKKSPIKKVKKFRLLLDSAFAQPLIFTRLCKKANVAHIRHTFNLSPQAEDQHIYQIAMETNRIVVTRDLDFEKLVKPKRPGTIILRRYITNETIDKHLTEFISGKDPDDLIGKAVKI